MAKLRDERFLCPIGLDSDSFTFLDMLMMKQLSNGACHSILFKLIMAILRQESSEALRRRYFLSRDLLINICLASSLLFLLFKLDDFYENSSLDFYVTLSSLEVLKIFGRAFTLINVDQYY